jgi:hypothetical protein
MRAAILLIFIIPFIAVQVSASDDEPTYSVGSWKEELGNHRARVQVAEPTDAVRVHLPWRLRDRNPQNKHILVIDAATGKVIDNVARIRIERESADIAFQPPAAGEYHVYFAPFTITPGSGWYSGDYLPPKDTAAAEWLSRNGLAAKQLAGGEWRKLPEAKLIDFQARSEFERRDPMELPATRAELEKLLADHSQPYLVFVEDREHPIRMDEAVPLRWIRGGPAHELVAGADRNEYFAFQIGLFAARQPLEKIALRFSDLRSADGKIIPAARLACINLEGVDHLGRPFHKTVSVGQGRVQALWCGIDVPPDAAPGEYHGTVLVQAEGVEPTEVRISLIVGEKTSADRGDNRPELHSRIRWLNSTLGIDDQPVPPYTPLEVEGNTIRCLGRRVELSPTGLPARISCGQRELLHWPMTFLVKTDDGYQSPDGGELKFTSQASGKVEWESAWKLGPLDVRLHGRMEFDGHQNYVISCRAPRDVELQDMLLQMYIRQPAAKYFMGFGRKGGYLPAEKFIRWKWGGATISDSFWIGDVPGGLHCELRGDDYNGPLINPYWHANQLRLPDSWFNGGRGGCEMFKTGEEIVTIRAYGGARKMAAGERLDFEFALLPTPVKPLDTAAHFRQRYYHAHESLNKVAAAGANVINIHHATPLLRYINYPFLKIDQLRAYTQAAHERGMKLKIYYTVRELTNHVTELWVLRSLGNEILAPGDGYGYPWLREHLLDNYQVAWYDHLEWPNKLAWPGGPERVEVSAAVNTQGNSRWLNYYVEGLRWLIENVEIDGLYLDDVSYDRETLKRMRKVMARRPGSMIDLHSCNTHARQPANNYMEFFPYVDRLWFGEMFDYDESPDYWLVEISGIPYGLMGEMLQDGGNRWRGMVYGMTARVPWGNCKDPLHIWPLWDSFGIAEAKMIGYWDPDCPVRTDNGEVLATAYVRPGKTLVAVASWAKQPVECRLKINWQTLGLDPAKVVLTAPEIKDYQPARSFAPDEPIPIEPGRGWLLLLEEKAK